MPAGIAFTVEETEAPRNVAMDLAGIYCIIFNIGWYLSSVLCQRCCKHVTHISSFNPHDNSTEVENIINSV